MPAVLFCLEETATAGHAERNFLEVRVTERLPSTSGDAGVEIRLKNGRSLIVRRGFGAEHVRALLAVAEDVG